MANTNCGSDYKTSYCSGCLSSDRVLSRLNENEEIFQIICGNYVLQAQIMLCWECTALLRGVRTFQRQVANAQKMLHFYCSQKQEQPQVPQCLSNLTFNTKTFSVTESNDSDVQQFVEEYKDLKNIKKEEVEVAEYKEDEEIKKGVVECEADLECKEIEYEQDLDCADDDKEDLDYTEDWSNSGSVEEGLDIKEETNEGESSNTSANPTNQLSEISKKKYERVYQDFIKWKLSKKIKSFSEYVLLRYFEKLAGKFKSSSLWTFYSMLKNKLNIKHDVDISKYSKLLAFLKRQAKGYTVKKSKTFSPEEINKFLKEAPNHEHLLTKIALIFGTIGACRRQELYNVLFTDVELYASTILVKIHNTKTNTVRTFTITGSNFELCKKYIKLRPEPSCNPYFFLNYRHGKCTTQKVGINKFGILGKTIASYLELPNPELYTGHCFRRTSATLLVNADGDISPLKRRHFQVQITPSDTPGMEQLQEPQCLSNLTFNTKTFSVTESNSSDVQQFVGEHNDLEVKVEVAEYKEDIKVKNEVVECEVDRECKKEIEYEQDLDCSEDENEDLDLTEEWSNGGFVEEGLDIKEGTNEGESFNTSANPTNQLSENSKKKYERVYQDFIKWRSSKNFKAFSEYVLLRYFEKLAGKFKSSTLWTFYSMLKNTLIIKHDVDISKYSKLLAFLKRQAEAYTAKKSKTFSPEEINKFLKEAPNHVHLLSKIALIFGIVGACRRQELYNVQFTDVELYDSTILVKINNTKTNTIRTFTITGSHFELCKKYIKLHPKPSCNPYFFLNYRHGKCTTQKVGITKFGNLGKTIASYLELPNPELYTGHCFRRTSATLLVNADGDISPLKRRHFQTQRTPGDTPSMEQPQIPHCPSNLTFNTNTFSVTETNASDVQQFVEEHKDLEVKVEVSEYKVDLEIKNEVVDCEVDLECKKEIEYEQDLDCADDEKEDLDYTEDWSNGSYVDEGLDSKEETNGGEPTTSAHPNNQLSEKSKKLYEKTYQDFNKWRLSNKFKSFSENVLLQYFEKLAGKFKSSSLWTLYSMLKNTLNVKHDVDISQYLKLMAFLKRQAEAYTAKKSKTFSPEEINNFLKKAPNDEYLLTKIALIFGIRGACRRQELYNVQFTDVELYDSTILVKINNTKTNTIRTFTLTGSYFELCKKYIKLRPEPCYNPYFFLNYRHGKCTPQKVGINKFGNLGKTIAGYLELPNPELYTGHCFRRSSTSTLMETFHR